MGINTLTHWRPRAGTPPCCVCSTVAERLGRPPRRRGGSRAGRPHWAAERARGPSSSSSSSPRDDVERRACVLCIVIWSNGWKWLIQIEFKSEQHWIWKNRLGLHASKEDLVRQLLPPCHLVNGVRKKIQINVWNVLIYFILYFSWLLHGKKSFERSFEFCEFHT